MADRRTAYVDRDIERNLASVILRQSTVKAYPPLGPARQTAGSQGGSGCQLGTHEGTFLQATGSIHLPGDGDYYPETLMEYSPGTDTHLAIAFTALLCVRHLSWRKRLQQRALTEEAIRRALTGE